MDADRQLSRGAFVVAYTGRARAYFHTTKTAGAKAGALFIANKTLAGVSFFLLNYAIFLGNIAIVNALEGVKYLFVLILAYYFSTRMPHILREQVTPLVVAQRSARSRSFVLDYLYWQWRKDGILRQ